MNIPSFDYKSNYLNMLTHKPTTLIPSVMLGNKILGFGPIPGPAIEKGDQGGTDLDGFGVPWVYTKAGPIPKPGVFLLEDITQWREIVKIPDPADYDWKAIYEADCAKVGYPDRKTQLVDFGFGNGVFERLAALMGFEEALLAMAEEPEEVYALMEAITDYKVKALDYIVDAYHPDTVTYYDDVATERSLFIAPRTYREIIKPHHKRFAQEAKNRGLIPIYHCCGLAQDIVEEMIDCGWAAWSYIQPTNDIAGMIEKYGDRFSFIGGYDTNGPVSQPGATPEMVAEETRRCLDTYGKYRRGYALFGINEEYFRYAFELLERDRQTKA